MMFKWRAKILAKRILSRLPVSYRRWASLGLFRHGDNDDPFYAWGVVEKHARFAPVRKNGWRGLELGPGDGLLTAFVAPAFGSCGTVLVDAGRFAHFDSARYRSAVAALRIKYPDADVPEFTGVIEVEHMLESVHGRYLSEGLSSLASLPAEGFDLIWSHAVLEHVRAGEYLETVRQLRRIIAPDGVMSHEIDFKDHLGGALNNLRFGSSTWEAESFAFRSGFYTNRLRFSQTVEIFISAGFSVEIIWIKRWGSSPIRRSQLASEFSGLTDDDLLVSGAHLIMRPV